MTKKKEVRKTEGVQPPEKPAKGRGLSKEDFAATFDFTTKTKLAIRRTLKELPEGRILKDSDFREECGIGSGNHGWRQVAESPEFFPYQFRLGDREVFWARPKTVAWACHNVAKTRRLE